MPPPGYEPFLRAICEDPEDDTVRLVYADWLDENGDPDRAEFIRLQIAVPVRPKEYDERYARVVEIQKRNWNAWQADLPALSGVGWDSSFSRGFVAAVIVHTGKWLLLHREALFAATPIQSLTIPDAGLATLTRLLDLSEVTRLTSLSLPQCRVKPGEWQTLAQCPRLVRLRRLAFDAPRIRMGRRSVPLDTDDIEAFLASPYLTNLERLRIAGRIDAGALDLLRSRFKDVQAWD